MIYFKNLRYQNILEIQNLKFEEHKITLLKGKSGCGKSTLFKLLLGDDFNFEGEITIGDFKVKYCDTQILRRKIGFIGQSEHLFKASIQEEFEFILGLNKCDPNAIDFNYFLKLVHLDKPLNTVINLLSGGEKQRVILARLLMLKRDIYLLDEPLSAIDHETSEIILNNLKAFQEAQNCTIIMTSHNKTLLETQAFSVINLEEYNESGR